MAGGPLLVARCRRRTAAVRRLLPARRTGAYLGLGWIDRIGDAGEILDDGGSPWSLILFGLFAIGGGLLLIDGGQRTLGFGAHARVVTTRRAAAAAALALTLLGLVLDLR